MRETRQSGSEGGARFYPSSLPLSDTSLPFVGRVPHAARLPSNQQLRDARLDACGTSVRLCFWLTFSKVAGRIT